MLIPRLPLVFAALFFAALCPRAAAQPASLKGLPVTAINISETRTSSTTILARMPLKPGTTWTPELEALTKKELHKMGIFRKLTVTSRYDESTGGVAVDVDANDGWYLIPIPMFTSGSSGNRVSLTLLSGNLFQRSEMIFLNGTTGKDMNSAFGGVKLGKYFIGAGAALEEVDESVYADSAYNTFASKLRPGRFGQPLYSYTRRCDKWSVSLGREIDTVQQAGVSFTHADYSFSNDTPYPTQGGLYNTIGAKYSYTLETGGGVARTAGSAGVIVGLGLSDLEEILKTRPSIGGAHTFEIKGSQAGSYTGSDTNFSMVQLSAQSVFEFQERDRLNILLSGAKGWNLPFTQQLPTGSARGLSGQYSREWRGDRGFGGTLSFSNLLSRSKRGLLVMEPFFSHAWVWNGDTRYYQTGTGLNFYYRFWRFPMPLGIGVTYSLHDKDVTASFSAGFGFGREGGGR